MDDAIPTCEQNSLHMGSRGGPVADKPIAEKTGQGPADPGRDLDLPGDRITHHGDGSPVGQLDRKILPASDRPPLGGQAEFGTMNATLLGTGEHDLGIDDFANWVGVDLLDDLRVLGEHRSLPLGCLLITSREGTDR